MTDVIDTKKPTKRGRRMAREPMPTTAGAQTEATPFANIAAKPASKANMVLEHLQRPEGTTISQLVAATGWQPHTTRAALTGLKKKGHAVTSNKVSGEDRVYRVVTD